MKFVMAAMTAAMVFASPVDAQEQVPLSLEKVEIVDGKLAGQGGATLLQAMENAQFVAVGEAHGYRGAPQLTRAIAMSVPANDPFDALVIETGPFTAAKLSETLKAGGVEAMPALLEGRNLSVPFFTLRDDAEMALPFVDGTISEDGLWGIDQEFIGSTLIHLETLQALATNDAQRAIAAQNLKTEREAAARMNMPALLLAMPNEQRFAALKAVYAGNRKGLALIQALETTARIYGANTTGAYYDNNHSRVELMKAQMLARYHASEVDAPRLLLRLGALHLGKGITRTHQFDIGSLIEGMAAANAKEALHIAFLPVGGKAIGLNPATGGYSERESNDEEMIAFLAALGYDMDRLDDGGMYLFDLAEIRAKLESRGINKLDAGNRFMLLGYDYLVTTKAAEAGIPLVN